METTTPIEIHAAMVAAIEAIEPTHPHARDARWKYLPADRDSGQAEGLSGTALRNFEIIVGPGAANGQCFYGDGGEEYEATWWVAAAYTGLTALEAETMAIADAVNLRRALQQLSEPTVPGVVAILHRREARREMDDAMNRYVEHEFLVRWNQQV